MNSYTMPGNTHSIEYWKPEEWETLFDMKSVLNCTKLLITQAQYETLFTSAFGSLIQHTLMTSLCSNSLSVIYTTRVTKSPTVPCREKPVSGFSEIVKETLRLEQLQYECRFCGNDSEVVSGAPFVKSRHNIITSQLNIHTISSQHMSNE